MWKNEKNAAVNRQYRYHENKENKMKYQKVKEKNNLHFK